jgi:putative nucleotidyltransferase with HDIG domain
MHSVSGSIQLMTLTDIMQWAETGQKSGSLTIKNDSTTKVFYLQNGKIIFVSSQKAGERLGEFFTQKGSISAEHMTAGLRESQRLGVSFTGYLITQGIIGHDALETLIQLLAETAFIDALTWSDGTFEFADTLPAMIKNGPVQISTSLVLFQSVKQIDESPEPKQSNTRSVIAEISRQIAAGNIEIPPAPVVTQKLNSMLQQDDTPVQDIVDVITADQILTAKILKVVNSAFYSPADKITSLRQAIIFMGLKSVLSIAAVHTISGFGSRNADKVKEILRHSLLCAYVARKIASAEQQNAVEAFACGLLHDIGKTVILNITEGLSLTNDERAQVVAEFHESTGYLVTSKWNFSDVLQVSAGYHHHPDQAPSHGAMVQIVHLADLVANNEDSASAAFSGLSKKLREMIEEISTERESILETVNAML